MKGLQRVLYRWMCVSLWSADHDLLACGEMWRSARPTGDPGPPPCQTLGKNPLIYCHNTSASCQHSVNLSIKQVQILFWSSPFQNEFKTNNFYFTLTAHVGLFIVTVYLPSLVVYNRRNKWQCMESPVKTCLWKQVILIEQQRYNG